jgi:hypothetical protein
MLNLCIWLQTGNVYQVRVLGALAMIDGGETDWKLLAVRTDDPLAEQVTGTAPPHTYSMHLPTGTCNILSCRL